MNFDFVRAESGIELILWLVIAFFWGLAQLATRGKKKKGKRSGQRPRPMRQERRPPPEAAPPIETELKEFLEGLGIPMEVAEPELPPRPEPLRQQIEIVPEKPRVMSDIMQAEEKIKKGRHKGPSPTPQPRRRARPASSKFEDVSSVSHTTVRPGSLMVGLDGLNMPLMNVPMITPHSIHHSATQAPTKNLQEIRSAVIGQILLGNPKAVTEEWKEF